MEPSKKIKNNGQLAKAKLSTFELFHSLRCFQIHSQSLLVAIFAVRLLTELTIVNLENFIVDPAFAFVFKVLGVLKLTEADNVPSYALALLIVVSLSELSLLLYVWMGPNAKNKNKDLILEVIKWQGIFVYAFRVFLVRTAAEALNIFIVSKNYLGAAFCGFVIVALIGHSYLMEQLNTESTLVLANRSCLSKSGHFLNETSELFLLIIASGVPLIPNIAYSIVLGINLALTAVYAMKISSSIVRRKYSSEMTEFLERVSSLSCLVFYFMVIPGYSVNLLRENLLLTSGVVLFFTYHSITNFVRYFNEGSVVYLEPLLKKKETLVNENGGLRLSEGHFLMFYLNHLLTEYKRDEESILISSLMSEHFRKCEKVACFCQGAVRSETKRKALEDRRFRTDFLLLFAKNIHTQFDCSFDVFVLYQLFKLQNGSRFADIEFFLLKYEHEHPRVSLSEQYTLFQVKHILKEWVDDQNAAVDFVSVEKVIREEDAYSRLSENLRRLIELDIEKYERLGEGICNLNKVEEKVGAAVALVREIELGYLECKRRNDYNLATQGLYYFYFSKVSIVNSEAGAIFNNLYIKSNYVKTLKGVTGAIIEKQMYGDGTCVFESNINPENFGVISNLNTNCKEVFGCKKEDLLYRNINKLFPKMFKKEHESILSQWISAGSYKAIGRARTSFTVDSKCRCFNFMVYIQISTSYQRLKMYTCITRYSGSSYMLLDESMVVQGHAENIRSDVFSQKSLSEPLKKICLNYESAIAPLKDSMPVGKLHAVQLLFTECKEASSIDKKESNVVEQIRQLAEKALRANQDIQALRCEAELQKLTFGRVTFYVLKFMESSDIELNPSELEEVEQQESHIQLKQKLSLVQERRSRLSRGNGLSDMRLQKQTMEQMEEENNDSEESIFEENELEEIQGQSTSSMMTEEAGYSFKKLIKVIKQKFLFSKNILFRELNNITILLAILSAFLMGLIYLEYFVYSFFLQGFYFVMEASKETFLVLEYLELMYGKAMAVYQYCDKSLIDSVCQQTLDESWSVLESFGLQFRTQFLKVQSESSSIGFEKYGYLMSEENVTLAATSHMLTVQNLFAKCEFSFKSIIQQFSRFGVRNETSDKSLIIFIENWKQIHLLTSKTMQSYQQNSVAILHQLRAFLYVISGIIVLLSFVISGVVYYFFGSTSKRKEAMIRNYQMVPISYVEAMKAYLQNIFKLFQESKVKISDQSFCPAVEENTYFRSKNQFVYKNMNSKFTFLIFMFLTLLLVSGSLSLYQMNTALEPLENIVTESTNWAISGEENLYFYLELKTIHLFDGEPNQNTLQQRIEKIRSQLNTSSIQFAERSIRIQEIFSLGNSCRQAVKKLLLSDFCDTVSGSIAREQIERCQNMKSSYSEYGVFPSMIYIHRESLKLFQKVEVNPGNKLQIFSEEEYRIMDQYCNYIFLILSEIQSKVNLEAKANMEQTYLSTLVTVCISLGLVLGGMIFWALVYAHTMRKFCELHGQALVFPPRVIKKYRKVMSDIESCLILKEY